MKIVILGCGRVGAALANLMANDGHEVTIIDLNGEAFGRLGRDFPGQTMVGDGTDEEGTHASSGHVEYLPRHRALLA